MGGLLLGVDLHILWTSTLTQFAQLNRIWSTAGTENH